jgi:hypothetical protein
MMRTTTAADTIAHFCGLGSLLGTAKAWGEVLEERCTVIIAGAGNASRSTRAIRPCPFACAAGGLLP